MRLAFSKSRFIRTNQFIVLPGGVFDIQTALMEIFHMLVPHHLQGEYDGNLVMRVAFCALVWVLIMAVEISLDTVWLAIALTDVVWVMALAIVASGVMRGVTAEQMACFLEVSRMYEVLGLFVLLLVDIVLMSEDGHLAHLALFGYEFGPMNKATFYLVLVTLLLVDVVQGCYQRKMMVEAAVKSTGRAAASR